MKKEKRENVRKEKISDKDKKYRERLTETIYKEDKDTLIERDKPRHKYRAIERKIKIQMQDTNIDRMTKTKTKTDKTSQRMVHLQKKTHRQRDRQTCVILLPRFTCYINTDF